MSSLASTGKEMLMSLQQERYGQRHYQQVYGDYLALGKLEDIGVNEGLDVGGEGDDTGCLMPSAEPQQP